MASNIDQQIEVRRAVEADAPAITRLFLAAYGEDYTYPQYYDEQHVKKLIYSNDMLMFVAEDVQARRVVGTGSVILEIGAYTDLVGEFGRLVVEPESRGRGVGTLLMRARLERVRDRLHVGLAEARTVHPFSVRIGQAHGFAPVGFVPMKNRFGNRRESPCILVQHFGNALQLRKNHPRIVPEAYPLAGLAMQNVGQELDAIVDEEAVPYSHGLGFDIQELTSDGYSKLLRIERGRVLRREIFGPLRLHYGFFKLVATHSTYLIARDKGKIAGAIGFTRDDAEQNIRIFELIYPNEAAIVFLLRELEQRSRDDWGIATIEIDVSAHAPRMQRTLVELGYIPTAYVPAMAFHRSERRDIIKMSRLLIPLRTSPVLVNWPAKEVAELVLRAFVRSQVQPKIGEAVDRIGLFEGLADEQARRLAGMFEYRRLEDGTTVFTQGETSQEMYIILSGSLDVFVEGATRPVGSVGAGECLGEVALLSNAGHSASALAVEPVELGVLTREALTDLIRQRPDVGVVLFRNVARGLGEKLRRVDLLNVIGTTDAA
jgi:GNAT superfamily N-acetyltransferase